MKRLKEALELLIIHSASKEEAKKIIMTIRSD